tara:strand:- start:116 stop:391 length:276 start_codon:yes stop_codon:yes gene_type:complete
MIDKLDKLNKNLTKLEELDNNKFSSHNFKEINQQLEAVTNQIMSSIKIDNKKIPSTDEKVFLTEILSKIEKLELKILPKANLLNSFSKSII